MDKCSKSLRNTSIKSPGRLHGDISGHVSWQPECHVPGPLCSVFSVSYHLITKPRPVPPCRNNPSWLANLDYMSITSGRGNWELLRVATIDYDTQSDQLEMCNNFRRSLKQEYKGFPADRPGLSVLLHLLSYIHCVRCLMPCIIITVISRNIMK